MKKFSLKAEERKILGRKVKKLRSQGRLPGNVFGKAIKSEAVSVSEEEFLKIFKEAGETGLVDLVLGKETRPVLVHSLQKDPVSGKILHADFLQVDLKEKVSAKVPLETVGESPAEKQGLGTVVTLIDEIEVEALPTDLPEKFEIDLSELTQVDQAILVKDLKVDAKKITLTASPDEILVKVEPLTKVEEEVAAPAEETPATTDTALPKTDENKPAVDQNSSEEKTASN